MFLFVMPLAKVPLAVVDFPLLETHHERSAMNKRNRYNKLTNKYLKAPFAQEYRNGP